jgi:hypothetical protein
MPGDAVEALAGPEALVQRWNRLFENVTGPASNACWKMRIFLSAT